MNNTRAVVNRPGGPKVLQVISEIMPEPGAGDTKPSRPHLSSTFLELAIRD